MSSITSSNAEQYSDSQKLAARARLHNKYTIAEYEWFSWIAEQLPFKAEDSILDIGCGPAWFWAKAIEVLPQDLHLTLSDLSLGMMQEAAERCRTLPLASVTGQQADAGNLPFDDASFNAVIAMHMLYHLPDPQAALAEMYRVLKPGGFVGVTTNGVNNMRELYALATVFGSAPCDPAGAAFGYDVAQKMLQDQFGNVTMTQYPAHLVVTDPEDVFLALTSYSPGDMADRIQLDALRKAIGNAFQAGNGGLKIEKESGLFISQKSI